MSEQQINDGGYWFEKFKEAQERIKRLEEVGDKMEIYCDTILARDWKEAKEAKP